LAGRVLHPLDDKRSFMKLSHLHSPSTGIAWSHCFSYTPQVCPRSCQEGWTRYSKHVSRADDRLIHTTQRDGKKSRNIIRRAQVHDPLDASQDKALASAFPRHLCHASNGPPYRAAHGHMTARYRYKHATWNVACALSGKVTVTASPCTGLAHHAHAPAWLTFTRRGRLAFAIGFPSRAALLPSRAHVLPCDRLPDTPGACPCFLRCDARWQWCSRRTCKARGSGCDRQQMPRHHGVA